MLSSNDEAARSVLRQIRYSTVSDFELFTTERRRSCDFSPFGYAQPVIFWTAPIGGRPLAPCHGLRVTARRRVSVGIRSDRLQKCDVTIL